MESLYVCLFSNGHIKVGRSASPDTRIKQHQERVACFGVTLEQSYKTECADSPEAREYALISRCTAAASQRHQREWFAGLDFNDVWRWAAEVAHGDFDIPKAPDLDAGLPDFRALVASLKAAGYTQADMAAECGCGQSSISDIATGVTKDPSYSVGAALMRLAQEVV
jgi:hypothetical protein